jgi:peptidoglycan hydrolase-like protein with peptidoglycan-binding domain
MNKNAKILLIGGSALALVAGYFVIKKRKQSNQLKKELETQESKTNNPPSQGNQFKNTLPVITAEWPLQKGSKGDKVKSLQRALNTKYKAGLKVDGNFGSDTLTALVRYTGKSSVSAIDFTKLVGTSADVSKIANAGKESILQKINPLNTLMKSWNLLNKPV